MSNEKELNGLTLLITGSSRGIGAATARLAASRGAKVILHGRSESKQLSELSRELDASVVFFDVGDADEARAKISSLGRIDVLINSAGVSTNTTFLEASTQDVESHLRTNFLGTYHCCQILIPQMIKNGGGRIVNVSSIRGHAALARNPLYAAGKAAVIALTTSLAKEFAPTIAVNSVSPGFTATEIADSWPPLVQEQAKSSLLKRSGTPLEIAEAILFLSSPRASFITATDLLVDGGYSASNK